MPTTTLEPFVHPILEQCRSLFPKTCPRCRKVYDSLATYVRTTTPVGPQHDYCDDNDDPMGFLSLVNCSCGTTLSLRCESPTIHQAFVRTLKNEARAQHRTASELLTELSDHVRALALSDPLDHESSDTPG